LENSRGGTPPLVIILLVLFCLFTSAIGVANVILAAASLAWLLTLWREDRWREPFSQPVMAALGFFIACLALSAAFSLHPERSLPALKGVFTFLLLPLFADSTRSSRDAYRYTGALALAAVVLSLDGLWQYVHGGDDLSHRITATLSHYMTFSGLLLLIALFAVGVALEGARRGKLPALVVAVITGGTLLLTFTRNAYVGFFAALIVYLAFRKPAGVLAVPMLALAIYALSPAEIRLRILSIFDPADPTNRDRLDMAVAGLRMIRDFPVFGLGLTLVKPYYPLYRVPDSLRWRVPHLHDNVLQIAAESGLFAAAAYAALLVLFFSRTIRLLRRETEPSRRGLLAGSLLAMTGITVAGFFEYNFGDVEVLMTTLVIFAIPFSRAFTESRAPV
jgi:O-antigen ligase